MSRGRARRAAAPTGAPSAARRSPSHPAPGPSRGEPGNPCHPWPEGAGPAPLTARCPRSSPSR
eukprot:7114535-Pyramimonas_sp.AAC.1